MKIKNYTKKISGDKISDFLFYLVVIFLTSVLVVGSLKLIQLLWTL